MQFKLHFYKLLPLISISLIGFLIYSNSLEGEFVFDDLTTIYHNSAIRDLGRFSDIWNMNPLRTVAHLSFALNYHFFGYSLFHFHLVNIIVHILSALSLFFLVKLLQKSPNIKNTPLSKNLFFPYIASLIFLTHPIQTQAVSYIVQRTTSLASLFYLLSLSFYVKSLLVKRNTMRKQLFSYRFISYLTFSYILAILAFFTKENSFTLPLSTLLIYLFFFKKTFKKQRKQIVVVSLYFILAVFVYLASFSNLFLNLSASRQLISIPTATDQKQITRLEYLLTQINVVRTYIRLLFFPVSQNLDYHFPLSKKFFELPTILSFAFLSSITAFASFIYKKNRFASFGIFFFFLALSVESTIIPLPDVIVEHRLYLPLAGFSIFTSALFISLSTFLQPKISKVQYKRVLKYGSFLFFVLFALSLATYNRNRVWQSRYTLWSDVVIKAPNNARGHYNLGVVLSYQDKTLERAKKEFEKAIELEPKYIEAYHLLGTVYERFGKYNKAEELYLNALKLYPDHTKARNSLGSLYAKLGRLNEAEKQYHKIIKIDPENASAYNNLGVVYLEQEKFKEALDMFQKAIDINAKYENAWYNLAVSYFKQGKENLSLEAYNQILTFNPQSEKAYFGIATIYKNQGKTELARRYYQKAKEIKLNF